MSTSAEKRARFVAAFDSIRDELLEHFASENMPKDAQEWYKRNLEYNVPGGKLNRGISVTDTVEILLGRPLDEKEYKRAAILGWGVEFLQAFFLVSDDMMDKSPTRRGQPCWYRVPGVGNIAINDSFMLEAAIYHLLKVYFREESYYVDLLELFHETTYQTEMGQLVDLITAPEDEVDLSKFSLEKHRFIVTYKTAYYSFYLPVALAMHMVQIPATATTHPNPYTLAKSILIPLGEYFQVQDDFLDCFGTPEQIGKVGTDIVDNKCSWLVNVALSVADEEQRGVLEECYGRKDVDADGVNVKEKRVKSLYEELGLRERYEVYEQESYERVMRLIETIPEDAKRGELNREVFRSFLGKIYKRTK